MNYTYRMADVRIGRFFAVDPLAAKYPHNGPYNFSENRVIDAIELEGLESDVLQYFSQGIADDLGFKRSENTNSEYVKDFTTDLAISTAKSMADPQNIGEAAGMALMFVGPILIPGPEEILLGKVLMSTNRRKVITNVVDVDIPKTGTFTKTNKTTKLNKTSNRSISSENANNSTIKQGNISKKPGTQSSSLSTGITNKGDLQTSGTIRPIEIKNGRVSLGETPLNGTVDFVITRSGELKVGKNHTYLSGGENVNAAGQLKFKKGQLMGIENTSGHYAPTVEESSKFLEQLQEVGVDVSKTTMTIYDFDNGGSATVVSPQNKAHPNNQ